ncbi:hypothetical protein SAMN04490357_7356 [Streptomyces misionensis]|uniref:Uncharacterized protein n=1 Tax=Streptomyces misionensis TaxID=67331 RepID=A0A1H5H5M7_9ACTN|nr:hypothetical protein [Streptomyces misionensis]SEE23001.1 hypothetical protein SAMN04490357_7356 [Streptomyces misionensis]
MDPLTALAAGRAAAGRRLPATGYVIGYVGREPALRVLGVAEWLSHRHRSALGALRADLRALPRHRP